MTVYNSVHEVRTVTIEPAQELQTGTASQTIRLTDKFGTVHLEINVFYDEQASKETLSNG